MHVLVRWSFTHICVLFPFYQPLALVYTLNFFWRWFFLAFFFVKQIHRTQIIKNIVGNTFSLTAIVFVRHFENEMPLTINHGREMSNISGNGPSLESTRMFETILFILLNLENDLLGKEWPFYVFRNNRKNWQVKNKPWHHLTWINMTSSWPSKDMISILYL